MPTRSSLSFTLSLLLLFLPLAASATTAATQVSRSQHQGKHPPQTASSLKETMHGIYAHLKEVYAASLQAQTFADPKKRAALLAHFEALKNLAGAVKGHGGDDKTFRFTGDSLAKDVVQAQAMFKQQAYAEAAFTLRHMTENCLSCHLRAPSKAVFAEDFISESLQKQLNPYELARLQTATRDFSKAEATYEALILDPHYTFAELLGSGILVDYLELMIEIKHNFQAPHSLLSKLLSKPAINATSEAKNLLELWLSALRKLDASAYFTKSASLQSARKLMAEAGQKSSDPLFPTSGLIFYITAAATLQDFVFAPASSSRDKAEAYHLLGGLESLLEQSFWLNEAQYYWESAICLAPHTPLAAEAFKALEANVREGFTGSGGTHIPDDIQAWLANLRAASMVSAKDSSGSKPSVQNCGNL